jgi:hypothetical protein
MKTCNHGNDLGPETKEKALLDDALTAKLIQEGFLLGRTHATV